jgi:hypothetical protein
MTSKQIIPHWIKQTQIPGRRMRMRIKRRQNDLERHEAKKERKMKPKKRMEEETRTQQKRRMNYGTRTRFLRERSHDAHPFLRSRMQANEKLRMFATKDVLLMLKMMMRMMRNQRGTTSI